MAAANFGGSSDQVAARQRLMGPPPPQGTVADLAVRLEVLEADNLSDAELFEEIRKTLLAGKTAIGHDNDGDTGRGNYSPLRPPRWYGGNRLGCAGLLLLLSESRENERQYTPYASMPLHHVSPATPHGGGVGGHAPSLVAPTVWNHRDCPGGQGSGLMEPPRHKRWGLGAGVHLRDDLSITILDEIVKGGVMVSDRTGTVAPF